MPSEAIVSSYVGGSAVHGTNKDGRFFVDPKHGHPIVEVSESTWRTVWWVQRLWPFSALIPGLLGMFLMSYGMGPNWKSLPDPPDEPPPWVMRLYLAGTAFIVGGPGCSGSPSASRGRRCSSVGSCFTSASQRSRGSTAVACASSKSGLAVSSHSTQYVSAEKDPCSNESRMDGQIWCSTTLPRDILLTPSDPMESP